MIFEFFARNFNAAIKTFTLYSLEALKLNWMLIAVLITQTFSVNIDFRQITEFFGIMQCLKLQRLVCVCAILGNIEFCNGIFLC